MHTSSHQFNIHYPPALSPVISLHTFAAMNVKTILFIDAAVSTVNIKMHTDITPLNLRTLIIMRETLMLHHILSYNAILTFCTKNHIPLSPRTMEGNIADLESAGLVTRELINSKAIFSITPEGYEYMRRIKTYITNKHY